MNLPYSHDEIIAAARLRAELPLLPPEKGMPPPELLDEYDRLRESGWSARKACTAANMNWRATA